MLGGGLHFLARSPFSKLSASSSVLSLESLTKKRKFGGAPKTFKGLPFMEMLFWRIQAGADNNISLPVCGQYSDHKIVLTLRQNEIVLS